MLNTWEAAIRFVRTERTEKLKAIDVARLLRWTGADGDSDQNAAAALIAGVHLLRLGLGRSRMRSAYSSGRGLGRLAPPLRYRLRVLRHRQPPGDAPRALAGLRVVADQREVALELDRAGQLS